MKKLKQSIIIMDEHDADKHKRKNLKNFVYYALIRNQLFEVPSSASPIDRGAWAPCEKCKSCWTCKFAIYPVICESSKCFSCDHLSGYEPLKFCSHCGRPLTEEAWAELGNQVRGLERGAL